MSNLVKYLHSGMPGAPVLSGTAGALNSVLDACLKDGFGLKTVDSLVVTGNVAVASISTGHSAEADTVVLIEGATPSALNGEWRVTATTTNTITFSVPGIADVSATGAMTVKMSPLGWLKPFSGTNLSVYKSADAQSSGVHLRVDGTPTTHAFVRGYESMSDVNTGIGPFPTPVQNSTGLYWPKSNAAGAAARNWLVVGDGLRFYFCSAAFGTEFYYVWPFGDILKLNSADAFNSVIGGGETTSEGTTASNNSAGNVGNSRVQAAGSFMPRSYTGLGGAVAGFVLGDGNTNLSASGLNSGGLNYGHGVYPNPVDNALLLSRVRHLQLPSFEHRSIFPGIFHVSQNAFAQFTSKTKVNGTGELNGRKLLSLLLGSTVVNGVVFFDVTGPWS